MFLYRSCSSPSSDRRRRHRSSRSTRLRSSRSRCRQRCCIRDCRRPGRRSTSRPGRPTRGRRTARTRLSLRTRTARHREGGPRRRLLRRVQRRCTSRGSGRGSRRLHGSPSRSDRTRCPPRLRSQDRRSRMRAGRGRRQARSMRTDPPSPTRRGTAAAS